MNPRSCCSRTKPLNSTKFFAAFLRCSRSFSSSRVSLVILSVKSATSSLRWSIRSAAAFPFSSAVRHYSFNARFSPPKSSTSFLRLRFSPFTRSLSAWATFNDVDTSASSSFKLSTAAASSFSNSSPTTRLSKRARAFISRRATLNSLRVAGMNWFFS